MAKKRAKKVKSGGAEAPTSDCILLCDDVLISQGRNKHNLIGVIGAINVAEFPAVVGAGSVAYLRFSNVYPGGQKIVLRFSRGSDEETIFEAEARFAEKSNPLGVHTLVIPLQPFVVNEPGRYLVIVYRPRAQCKPDLARRD